MRRLYTVLAKSGSHRSSSGIVVRTSATRLRVDLSLLSILSQQLAGCRPFCEPGLAPDLADAGSLMKTRIPSASPKPPRRHLGPARDKINPDAAPKGICSRRPAAIFMDGKKGIANASFRASPCCFLAALFSVTTLQKKVESPHPAAFIAFMRILSLFKRTAPP
jgi:hypothetical protein